jgi:hypothetical protein
MSTEYSTAKETRMLGRKHSTPGYDPASHDVFYGPVGSGKTGLARTYMEEDDISQEGVAVWVVDPFLALAESQGKVDRYARDFEDIDDLLADLLPVTFTRAEHLANLGMLKFAIGDKRHEMPLISVTIADADHVLRDARRARAVEQTMRMSRRAGIKFRLIVPSLLITSFGCSEVIRSSVLNGNVLACEKATA